MVLISLIIHGFIYALLLGFSAQVPSFNCDQYITGSRDRLVVLTIASMTVAATLLTTTPAESGVKQFSFLLIAVTGFVAAAVAIEPRSWGLVTFLIVNGAEILGHWGVEGLHKCPARCSA